MTLPAVPTVTPNNNNNNKPPFLRRTSCRSAVWAETPIINKRERRRAICSWSAGYGTLLDDSEETFKLVDKNKKGKVAKSSSSASISPASQQQPRRTSLIAMPGIRSLWSNKQQRRGANNAQAAPLVGLKTTRTTPTILHPTGSLANLRKCETVVAMTEYLRSSSSSSSIEPLQPVNRLRVSPHASNSRMCSRCSSLLTLASASRYSLNSTTGGFVPITAEEPPLLCKLCLVEVPKSDVVQIEQCNCAFCIECMKAYVKFEIMEGAYDVSCPDARCPSQGVLNREEIKKLAGADLVEKHTRYRLNHEVEMDKTRTWCPKAGCETVCKLCKPKQPCHPQSVFCPTCLTDFCSNCKLKWHEGMSCEELKAKEDKKDVGIPFDSDLIKCCPMCNVPIEKDEGCAQMMCKRCKHVFCWYCLASLDDDFLLRHYDKGPCKNKLGHSRASVIWHRTQVIGIFAGFGILLLMASPLLLLAAPCIVCCKCRFCNSSSSSTTRLSNEEEEEEENAVEVGNDGNS